MINFDDLPVNFAVSMVGYGRKRIPNHSNLWVEFDLFKVLDSNAFIIKMYKGNGAGLNIAEMIFQSSATYSGHQVRWWVKNKKDEHEQYSIIQSTLQSLYDACCCLGFICKFRDKS